MNEELFEESIVDERTDAVILALGEMIQEEESKVAILNPLKFRQMKLCYALIQRFLSAPGVILSYSLHEPFKSMGSITLEADKFILKNPEYLRLANTLASNMEAYPLTNGKIRMVFTFFGLTKSIE